MTCVGVGLKSLVQEEKGELSGIEGRSRRVREGGGTPTTEVPGVARRKDLSVSGAMTVRKDNVIIVQEGRTASRGVPDAL